MANKALKRVNQVMRERVKLAQQIVDRVSPINEPIRKSTFRMARDLAFRAIK